MTSYSSDPYFQAVKLCLEHGCSLTSVKVWHVLFIYLVCFALYIPKSTGFQKRKEKAVGYVSFFWRIHSSVDTLPRRAVVQFLILSSPTG